MAETKPATRRFKIMCLLPVVVIGLSAAAQSPSVPQWQTDAGGKMALRLPQ
jgi:hypothetical protein